MNPIAWRGNAPYSLQFNDVYFQADGLAESRHVFLAGNHLPARFVGANDFVIGETGFGTGLNFLATLDALYHTAPSCRLDYYTVEHYPLCSADMAKAHAAFPELSTYSQALLSVYPPIIQNGMQALRVTDTIALHIFVGDVVDGIAAIPHSVDAWYWDGFAPARNPAMWQDNVIAAMAHKTKMGGTFATFTAAGHVKRSAAAHGFDVQKIAGYGRKRDMLVGQKKTT